MDWISQFGVPALFVAGLLEFLGLPFPGALILLSGGALAGAGKFSLTLAWAAAAAGAVVADQIWFRIARARGAQLLATACRVSVNPSACLRQTRRFLDRFGPRALLFAKFVPGMSNVATPVAAVSGVLPRVFAAYSALGAVLWAGVWLGLGAWLRSSLLPVLEEVLTWAPRAVGILAAVAFVLLAVKAAAGGWAVRADARFRRTQPQEDLQASGPRKEA